MKRIAYALAGALLASGAHAEPPPPVFDHPYIPPPEFDQAYKGELVIVDNLDEETIRKMCRVSRFVVGCRVEEDSKRCVIALATPHLVEQGGYTIERLLRHEIAHCNGWRHPIVPGVPWLSPKAFIPFSPRGFKDPNQENDHDR
jgi:hypothetical protein